ESEMLSQFNYFTYVANGYETEHTFSSSKELNNNKKRFCLFDFSNINPKEFNLIKTNCELLISQSIINNEIKYYSYEGDSYNIRRSQYHLLLSQLADSNPNVMLYFQNTVSESLSEKVAKIVSSDYSVNWTISTLARRLNMSESTFKKNMYKNSRSVSCFINRLKVIEGLRRLRRTNQSLTEISHNLGYCTNSYFTQVFIKYFGIPPSSVRR
ncbi:AraC family transcriptional regulator, partial [Yersinia enterocolitica]|nr:AraC family transcriptional regulator [Yersinia enterocolitica]